MKLEEVFGSSPDPDESGDTSQLYEQINKLNKTIQNAYNSALENSLGKSKSYVLSWHCYRKPSFFMLNFFLFSGFRSCRCQTVGGHN